MADPDGFADMKDVWDRLVALEGEPAPNVTLRGFADSRLLRPEASSGISLVWGSVFDTTAPVTTGDAAAVSVDAPPRVGGGLALRVNRVAMKAEDASEPAPDAGAGEDYLVLGELGRGGMGVVYNARQGSLGRNVAVKMISPSIAGNEGARRKMVSEALVIGELDHPNIIPIYDLGRTEQNNLFYAMKTVKGTPWSGRIRSNSLRENLGILMRVADAVAFAHDKGFIHRDLKPGNVMLGDYGEVLLMDWGLAVSLDPSSRAERLTPFNAVAGTPAYMAPEMALGRAGKIGRQSDIYLLGAILYEIVTGHRPHRGTDSRDCLRAAAANEIAPAAISDDLLRVALSAMATDPAERHPTVKAFQGAIDEVETHRESRDMTAAAEAHLAGAEAREEYGDFSQAVFAFREAARLWPGNARAVSGEAAARKKYAACAFARNDFDLALENLGGLGDDDSLALAAKVRRARDIRQLRQKRIRLLTVAAAGLTAAVVIILAASTVIVTDRMKREQEARMQAKQALLDSNAARERERQASVERERALQREKGALLRERDAREERLAALAQAENERRRKEAAERERMSLADEMSRKGQLEDASWWAFDAAEAVRRRNAAAETAGAVVRDVSMGSETMAFSLIPAGEFVMGSNPRSGWHAPDEFLHRVVISEPFYLGRGEVTRAQWRAAVGVEDAGRLMPAYHPLYRGESEDDFRAGQLDIWGWRTRPLEADERDLPATGISAEEIDRLFLPAAAAFVPAGWEAALPSEAQWEYAARSGSSGPYFGHESGEPLSLPGWTRENSRLRLRAAGGHPANAWGLADMHGNAGEIVRDMYSPDYYLSSPRTDPVNTGAGDFRVYRGGNILHAAVDSLSAGRHRIHPDNRYAQVGFRLSLRRKR